MMDARRIIAAKRDGRALNAAELQWFAGGLASGSITDAQAGAFAMAVLLNGMDEAERVALTLAMRDSGEVQAWDMPGPVLDKHSTGGIGDNVSLLLAPALAVCGAYVPMISGRGLGHTGGTLDKLDAIPGYQSEVSAEDMRRVVGEVGCAIVGATGGIAPADKRLYAIRDVTGTVESLDLITASILSKKLAAGLEGLVLDVKIGSGAFLSGADQAGALAEALVGVANGAGCRTAALITDMNEPLASVAGNALEVANAVEFLTGKARDRRLEQVTLALAAEMLHLCGIAVSYREGAARALDALGSGRAAEVFGRMTAQLGGPADFVENYARYLETAPVIRPVKASKDGFVRAIATYDVGMCVVALGGGRSRAGDEIDHSVGLSRLLPVGAAVHKGDTLALVHAANDHEADRAQKAVMAAYAIGDEKPPARKAVIRRIVG